MKKLIYAILVSLLLVTLFSVVSQAAEYTYEGNVIYLSDKGNDENDGRTPEKPKKLLEAAAKAAGTGGTVVITDYYTYATPYWIPTCTIAGLNDKSTFTSTA